MPLKCPICEEEYFYDSKICQSCENESNNRGFLYTYKRSQKWNCGIFTEFDTLTFGHQKPNEVFIKIASEPKFSDFKPKGLNTIKQFPAIDLKIFKQEKNKALIYE